ncbi:MULTISPECIES: hypothetical protein [unclassified Streptomyces]|uniref:hypothetical protein n=1 Tax=unclassified Streptomyces TaxID=2593676 RepID=UPI000B805340|nr:MULTISPECIES: hypothetical protein [unclassified Streptomyces]
MKYFNKTGWTAYFSGVEGGEMARMRDVEAWDPVTGAALVVDTAAGTLRPVTSFSDFSRLERAGRVVGVLPGGGWRARWDDEDDGVTTEDVVGWLVSDVGGVMPLVVSGEGLVEFADSADSLMPPVNQE